MSARHEHESNGTASGKRKIARHSHLALKARAVLQGLSQLELARLTGLDKATVCLALNGRRSLPGARKRIAAALAGAEAA